jgi:hypothetical protein
MNQKLCEYPIEVFSPAQILAGLFALSWILSPLAAQESSASPLTTGICTFVGTVVRTDFNSDEIVDSVKLVHEGFDRSQIQICVSGFSRSNEFVVDEKIVRVIVLDIDRDGDFDLIALTRVPRLLVCLNDGRSPFSSQAPCPPSEPLAKHVLNSDSDSELPISASLPSACPTLRAKVYFVCSIFSHEWSAPGCGFPLKTSPRAPPPGRNFFTL